MSSDGVVLGEILGTLRAVADDVQRLSKQVSDVDEKVDALTESTGVEHADLLAELAKKKIA